MRIDSSVIGMESARRYSSSVTKTGYVGITDYEGAVAGGVADAFGGLLWTGNGQEETRETSEEKNSENKGMNGGNASFASLKDLQGSMIRVTKKSVSLYRREDTVENFRQLSLRYIFKLLFGEEKTKSFFGDSVDSLSENQNYQDWKEQYNANLTGSQSLKAFQSQQYLVIHQKVTFAESEQTAFQAQGVVRTADGREISINVDVEMSREFSAYYEENFAMGKINTCDPLVINLDGDIAGLSNQKFFFDIDADGEEDEISMLESGSGYLALDKNNDGRINDGSELFGTKSGNGFADLAAYDEDGNGWIDENDKIWSKLKIWCKDESGEDKLYTLKESGVGAICLKNTSTNYTLGNSAGANGYIRQTGIFLYENGNVGTVQHLDLAR